MNPSLIFLQSYANAECILKDTTSEEFQVIYHSGRLAILQDGLLAQQSATLIGYVMTQNDTLIIFLP